MDWEKWRDAVVQTGEEMLGFKRGSRKEAWISKEMWKAIDEQEKLETKDGTGEGAR